MKQVRQLEVRIHSRYADKSTSAPAPLQMIRLQTALAKGHRWLRQIENGQLSKLTEIAKREIWTAATAVVCST